ncbi:MAG TPA: 2Fe-2S iron-sulfur cluster-binding protein [Solirubrobacteraceae bacterium]|nr:2Fe-2S iron-sulfur cluster-binding protein [Solirubrobacteraceae bacterium]
MSADADTRRLRVYRFKRGDPAGEHFDEFEVPVDAGTTLLDALVWIQHHRDRTLALRASCHHAACGTCGVQANGREVLACVTPFDGLGRRITVEPLANLPVLADLVVDMREFFERFHDGHPLVRDSELVAGAEPPEDLGRFMRYDDCIECALCLSACPVAATARAYAGPAALGAAQRCLEEDPSLAEGDLLDWADAPDGVWRCHIGYECTAVCPSDFKPAERLMALRGRLVRAPARRRAVRS